MVEGGQSIRTVPYARQLALFDGAPVEAVTGPGDTMLENGGITISSTLPPGAKLRTQCMIGTGSEDITQ